MVLQQQQLFFTRKRPLETTTEVADSAACQRTAGVSHTAEPSSPGALDQVRQTLPMTDDKEQDAVAASVPTVMSSDDEDDAEEAAAILEAQRQARALASAGAAATSTSAPRARGEAAGDTSAHGSPVPDGDTPGANEPMRGPTAPASATPATSATAATAATAASARGSNLSEYEQQRLLNIARNQEVLASLGLADDPPLCAPRVAKGTRRRPRPQAPPPPPSNRSLRSRVAPVAQAEPVEGEEPLEPVPLPAVEPEPVYDTSDVVRYVCTDEAPLRAYADASGSEGEDRSGGSQLGWRRAGEALDTTKIVKRVYGIDAMCKGDYSRRPVLACGGDKGFVAVFPAQGLVLDDAPEPSPLLAWQAHKGWVGGVQFASMQAGAMGSTASTLLLTSSNAGEVCVWDINKASNGTPRQASCVSLGSIWELHEQGGLVLTASKDATITLVELSSTGLKTVQSYDDLHGKVIKTVRWRDANVFASAGNEADIVVVDRRERQKSGGTLRIDDASTKCINCLRWSPSDEHMVLSNGFELAARLHDIRKPVSAHAPATLSCPAAPLAPNSSPMQPFDAPCRPPNPGRRLRFTSFLATTRGPA